SLAGSGRGACRERLARGDGDAAGVSGELLREPAAFGPDHDHPAATALRPLELDRHARGTSVHLDCANLGWIDGERVAVADVHEEWRTVQEVLWSAVAQEISLSP